MLPHPDTAQDSDWRHYSLFYIFRHYPLFFFKRKKIMSLLRNSTQFSVLYPRSSSERRKRLLKSHTSVPNSSYGLIFVKILAKYGRIFSKNTSEILAKIRAKFMFTTKNSKIENEQNTLFS